MDVTRAKSGKFYKEIFIVDQTEETISVFLWEADAEEFKGTENEPIAIRGALIRKQNDDNVLNIVAKSTIEVYTLTIKQPRSNYSKILKCKHLLFL